MVIMLANKQTFDMGCTKKQTFGLSGAFGFDGGDLKVRRAHTSCYFTLVRDYPTREKRIVFLTGGPPDFSCEGAKFYGNQLKEAGIGVDVYNFRVKGDYYYGGLQSLYDVYVGAANCNNNSFIQHVDSWSLSLTTGFLPSSPEKEIENKARNNKGKGSKEVFERFEYLRGQLNNLPSELAREVDNYFKARGMGCLELKKLDNKFKASPDNDKKKKRKNYFKARGMRPLMGRLELKKLDNKSKASPDNDNPKLKKKRRMKYKSTGSREAKTGEMVLNLSVK
ncbi:uncharacterized protein [Rutidosis leptorrhynchoides]|uniref:uncharacterized protein n=1 Tax=Rutidosis leptorrhynchoides TaxID=125765 RepID=UPI003A98DB8A